MADVTASATTEGPVDGALGRVARVLWPDGDGGHRLRDRAGAGPRQERYAAVPSARRPRFLLPLDAPAGTRARLLLQYNHLRTDRRRAQRLALAAVVRAGALRARPGRGLLVAEPDGAPTLRAVVADAIGAEETAIVLSVGVRPGTGPLVPTVTVVDLDGRPRVFVKVADTAETRAELDAEHDVLATLRLPAATGVHVPAPVLRVEWGDALVVGIEPLPLDVRRVGPDELDAVQPWLERIVAAHPTQRLTLGASPWTRRLRSVLAGVPSRWAGPLGDRLESLLTAHGDAPLDHGLRHGDWSSWNMAWSRTAGGLAVWDWEFSEPLAPVGLDRCNWHFAYDTSVRGVTMTDAAARLRALAADGVVDRDATELFLLDMAVRRAGQGADGDHASAAYADELAALLG